MRWASGACSSKVGLVADDLKKGPDGGLIAVTASCTTQTPVPRCNAQHLQRRPGRTARTVPGETQGLERRNLGGLLRDGAVGI